MVVAVAIPPPAIIAVVVAIMAAPIAVVAIAAPAVITVTIPIAVSPEVAVAVKPPALEPAALARFAKFFSVMARLAAVEAVALDIAVELDFLATHALEALVVAVARLGRRPAKQQNPA